MAALTFPCTVTLSSYSDLLVLERVIRDMLQCQGPMCSFLQSAEYKRMKFSITRALTQRNAPPAPLAADDEDNDDTAKKVIHIPHSQLVMYVSDDCGTVLIQNKASVYLEVSAPPAAAGKRKKRGAPAAKNARGKQRGKSQAEDDEIAAKTQRTDFSDADEEEAVDDDDALQAVFLLKEEARLANRRAPQVGSIVAANLSPSCFPAESGAAANGGAAAGGVGCSTTW